MKNKFSKLLLVVLAVAFMSGCTQQPAPKENLASIDYQRIQRRHKT